MNLNMTPGKYFVKTNSGNDDMTGIQFWVNKAYNGSRRNI